jgi:hypothetical protein
MSERLWKVVQQGGFGFKFDCGISIRRDASELGSREVNDGIRDHRYTPDYVI